MGPSAWWEGTEPRCRNIGRRRRGITARRGIAEARRRNTSLRAEKGMTRASVAHRDIVNRRESLRRAGFHPVDSRLDSRETARGRLTPRPGRPPGSPRAPSAAARGGWDSPPRAAKATTSSSSPSSSLDSTLFAATTARLARPPLRESPPAYRAPRARRVSTRVMTASSATAMVKKIRQDVAGTPSASSSASASAARVRRRVRRTTAVAGAVERAVAADARAPPRSGRGTRGPGRRWRRRRG